MQLQMYNEVADVQEKNNEVVNVLTKPLSHVKFEYFRDKLGVVQKDLPWKRE